MLELATRARLYPAFERSREDASAEPEMLLELLSIAKTTRAFYGMKLAELGFHNGQDELLLALDDDAVTVTALADQLSVRPSTVSKMLDRLIDKGLCERIDDRQDGRRTLIRITDAGIDVRRTVVQLRKEVEADLSKTLDPDVYVSIKQSLSLCSGHLSQQLRRLR